MEFTNYRLFLISGIIILTACVEESQNDDKAELNRKREAIISFAKTNQCADDSQCRYMGIGSKPCGGPWDYVVYSTSLDTTRLFQMISEYNALEREYNRKWGLVSDCSIPPPPDSVVCRDGACVGYRNGNELNK